MHQTYLLSWPLDVALDGVVLAWPRCFEFWFCWSYLFCFISRWTLCLGCAQLWLEYLLRLHLDSDAFGNNTCTLHIVTLLLQCVVYWADQLKGSAGAKCRETCHCTHFVPLTSSRLLVPIQSVNYVNRYQVLYGMAPVSSRDHFAKYKYMHLI